MRSSPDIDFNGLRESQGPETVHLRLCSNLLEALEPAAVRATAGSKPIHIGPLWSILGNRLLPVKKFPQLIC